MSSRLSRSSMPATRRCWSLGLLVPCSRSFNVRGIRVGPAVEVLLAVGGDRAELRLLPAGRDDELVVVEERRAALALGAALFAVAQELVDGLGNRRPSPSATCTRSTTTGRPFRNSTMSGKMWCSVPRMRTLNWQTAMKRLLSRVLEVDEANRRALLARLAVLADAGVLEQQLEDDAVVLDQARAGEAGGELLDDFLDLVVFKPRVDDLQLLAQHRAA